MAKKKPLDWGSHPLDQCFDQIEEKVAARVLAIPRDELTNCHGCGVEYTYDNPPHVDNYHRFTSLCGKCYRDPVVWERTKKTVDDL